MIDTKQYVGNIEKLIKNKWVVVQEVRNRGQEEFNKKCLYFIDKLKNKDGGKYRFVLNTTND